MNPVVKEARVGETEVVEKSNVTFLGPSTSMEPPSHGAPKGLHEALHRSRSNEP